MRMARYVMTCKGCRKCTADNKVAITLGYFERLLSCGDASQLLLQEEARLRSLTNIVRLSGIDPDIYEDFAFPTFTLLRDLGTAVRNGTAQALLIERFCDEETQNFVITQMKVKLNARPSG